LHIYLRLLVNEELFIGMLSLNFREDVRLSYYSEECQQCLNRRFMVQSDFVALRADVQLRSSFPWHIVRIPRSAVC